MSSLGLLYTTLSRGADQVMIPNTQVLAAVVVPLREPDSVDVKVRLTSGVRPSQVQAILDQEITTPMRSGASSSSRSRRRRCRRARPGDAGELHDGAKLADEIMVALSSVTGEHEAAGARPRGLAVGYERSSR